MFKRLVFTSLATLGLALAGCEDDHGHVSDRPTCDELAEACHTSTSQAGLACHHQVEDPATTEAECVAARPACLAECTPTPGADAGPDSDAGDGADAGHGH